MHMGFLRRLLPFAHGVPSHDQLGNVFARLDAQQFQSCFIAWVERFTTAVRGVVAVDGKTLRRSFDRAAKQGPIHMISAWSSQQRLVLGQCKVANKSNEITAIPELLQLLELHGAVVTIDAMGCQRTIAAQINVFGLKGNQHKDVALLFDERQDGFAGHAVTLHHALTDDLAWLHGPLTAGHAQRSEGREPA